MSGRRRLTFMLTAATKSSRVLRIRIVDPTGALLAAYQKQLASGDSTNAAADAVGVDVRYLKGVVTVELSQNDSGQYTA